jgi:RNA polymerase sigma factor (sigma-70 family)
VSPWLSGRLLRTLTDERLAALAGEGHERAFAVLVDRYRRSLLGFTRGLGAGGRAEDIVQQVFMQAWVALSAGAEVDHVRGWLHQIARRATWRAIVPTTDELPATLAAAFDTESEVERRLEAHWLLTALEDLPERQRDALVQTALHGRSGQEVAGGLGLSENALRQLLFRARTTLRAAAGALLPPPVVAWAAARGASSAPVGERVAELVAAGGSAGVMASVMKTAAIVAVAGSAVAGGTAVRHAAHDFAGVMPATDSARRAAPPRVARGTLAATASVADIRRAPSPLRKPVRSPSSSASGSPATRPQPRGPAGGAAPAPAPARSIAGRSGEGDGAEGSGASHDVADTPESSAGHDGSGSETTGGQGASQPDEQEVAQAPPNQVPEAQDVHASSDGSGEGESEPHASQGPVAPSGTSSDDGHTSDEVAP